MSGECVKDGCVASVWAGSYCQRHQPRDERPLISEHNARDLSPEMRAKYHVINPRPLTPDEVKRAYAFARQEAQPGSLLVYLLADLDRLRALVNEKANQFDHCVWCGREMPYGYRDEKRIEHTHDCPACTPEGEVR